MSNSHDENGGRKKSIGGNGRSGKYVRFGVDTNNNNITQTMLANDRTLQWIKGSSKEHKNSDQDRLIYIK